MFQWRRGTTALTNGGNLSGTNTPTLTINPAVLGDVASNYNCVVSIACGSATTDDAALNVNTAPQIAGQPSNTSGCEGGAASFTVSATGSPPPTFQWRRGTHNLPETGRFHGTTTATLTIDPIQWYEGDFSYNCVVSTPCGSVTSGSVSVAVLSAPAVTGQPSDAAVCAGAASSFSVSAGGSQPRTYQWRRGTTNLENGGSLSGVTSSTLTINPVTPGDAASDYNCVIGNACGSVASNNAALTVNSPAAITGQPANQTVCPGDTASFSVTAGGAPTPTFQWRRGTTALTDGGNVSGAATAILTINPVAAVDRGEYRCIVSNACGTSLSDAATLAITVISGDWTEDGVVNGDDYALVLPCFAGPGMPNGGCAPALFSVADFDDDSDIDMLDFAEFQRLVGSACP